MTSLTIIFIFLFGLAIGSFLNVLISRLPVSESILYPSSHCPACKTPLKIVDLIPILSYILNFGKCRYCGERISLRYLIIETITPILFVLLYFKCHLSIDFFLFLILASLLLVGAFTDMERGIIPDSITILGVIPGIILNTWEGNFNRSLIGMLLGFFLMFIISKVSFYLLKREAMGDGDIKFSMMLGAYVGPAILLFALFSAYILGALVGISLVLLHIKTLKEEVPLGPAISFASILAIFLGRDILNWYLYMI